MVQLNNISLKALSWAKPCSAIILSPEVDLIVFNRPFGFYADSKKSITKLPAITL